jgi:Ca2+-binding EF-hand superfamily protein
MMLHRADTDQDGKVTKDEFTKAAPDAPEDAFVRMDRNGDGVLNKEDRPEDGSGRQGRQGRRGGPGGPGHGQRIKAMDTNEDGNISSDEFKAGHPNAPEDAFERMDNNGDGVLNRDDFQGRGRGQGPKDGSGPRGARGGRRGAPPAPVE